MRTPEGKSQRRQTLLEVGQKLFADQPYASLRIQDLVTAAGLAKGTFYLYFASKESLFLRILLDALADWNAFLCQRLQSPLAADALADLLTQSVSSRHELRRLLALLHPVIEAQLDAASARAFKQELSLQLAPLALALERVFAPLKPGDGLRLLMHLNALVMGLEYMSRPHPVMAEVLQDPALAPLKLDFDTALHHALLCLLSGWQSESVNPSQ
ncbi:MAG: TetR family transcriptional regulator [Candidatus Sericytochromatia bacterium]